MSAIFAKRSVIFVVCLGAVLAAGSVDTLLMDLICVAACIAALMHVR